MYKNTLLKVKEREVFIMLCIRCRAKGLSYKKQTIICKKCGKEAVVNIFNNNKCQKCNEADETCEECGRKLTQEDIAEAKKY